MRDIQSRAVIVESFKIKLSAPASNRLRRTPPVGHPGFFFARRWAVIRRQRAQILKLPARIEQVVELDDLRFKKVGWERRVADPNYYFGGEVFLDEGELGVEFGGFEECAGIGDDRVWLSFVGMMQGVRGWLLGRATGASHGWLCVFARA